MVTKKKRTPTDRRKAQVAGAGRSEVGWVSSELLPLLRRLGFPFVSSQHGANELGKDVVLADRDRFGLHRYWAVQAKVGPIGVGKSLEDLIAQLRMAYATEAIDGTVGTRRKVSGVYLIVATTVTPQARERLMVEVGQWLHVIDGDHLSTLRAALDAQDVADRAWQGVTGGRADREAVLVERADAIVRRAYEVAGQDHSAGPVIRGYPVALKDPIDVDAAHRLQGDDRIESIVVREGYAEVHVVRAGVPRHLVRATGSTRGPTWIPS